MLNIIPKTEQQFKANIDKTTIEIGCLKEQHLLATHNRLFALECAIQQLQELWLKQEEVATLHIQSKEIKGIRHAEILFAKATTAIKKMQSASIYL